MIVPTEVDAEAPTSATVVAVDAVIVPCADVTAMPDNDGAISADTAGTTTIKKLFVRTTEPPIVTDSDSGDNVDSAF